MLQRVAAQLGADVQRRAMQMATILEPLLIVAMGMVVMLIVLAVMLPIIQLNAAASHAARRPGATSSRSTPTCSCRPT
jgi:type II secretory pathway component PulF